MVYQSVSVYTWTCTLWAEAGGGSAFGGFSLQRVSSWADAQWSGGGAVTACDERLSPGCASVCVCFRLCLLAGQEAATRY